MSHKPTPAPANEKQHSDLPAFDYTLGIFSTVVLSALIIVLMHSYFTQRVGYGVIGVAMAAMFICLPLALAHFGLWIFYALKKPPPTWVHMAMFSPFVLVPALFFIADSADQSKLSITDGKFPPMPETHINLSGDNMLPDVMQLSIGHGKRSHMTGDDFATFLHGVRYHSQSQMMKRNDLKQGYLWLYESGHIAPTATTIRREFMLFDPAGELIEKYEKHVPLIKNMPYPDSTDLPRRLNSLAGQYQHIFFHYPDHTEVAPALINFGQITREALYGQVSDFVEVVAYPLGLKYIARLQINGQEVSLGQYSAPTPSEHPKFNPNASCKGIGGFARVPLPGDVHMRWHSNEQPFEWQERNVQVPAFSIGEPDPKTVTIQRLELYINPDGNVYVQRIQWLTSGDVRIVPVSGIQAPCAYAYRR